MLPEDREPPSNVGQSSESHFCSNSTHAKNSIEANTTSKHVWNEFGTQFQEDDINALQSSIVEMALSRVQDVDDLYVGGLWALRRSDSLAERKITHVLSLVPFEPASLKNFKEESWEEFGKGFEHLVIDVHDVDDEDLLVELPKAVRFIHQGLTGEEGERDVADEVAKMKIGEGADGKEEEEKKRKGGAVLVHCAAGKSRSAASVLAYLLWRYPLRFDPDATTSSSSPTATKRSRKDTAKEAVAAALAHLRVTRPMAEPNDGFMAQLALYWEMGCPEDVENHPTYKRWSYKREVQESAAVGQAPSRLRFEDEEGIAGTERGVGVGVELRCKKCRRTLATEPFIATHDPRQADKDEADAGAEGEEDEASAPTPPTKPPANCPHVYIEPLSWMRDELEKGSLNGRLLCPNARCGAGVGRYDWRGFKCSCGNWVCPAFSLQRARVDEIIKRAGGGSVGRPGGGGGIRMPPGLRGGNL